MSKKKNPEAPEKENQTAENTAAENTENTANTPEQAPEAPAPEMIEKDTYLRLAAEYDNFRKRSQKEKEGIYADARANTVAALLPVYDNLERALKAECSDEAFKKGVEMTMTQLKEIFAKLGVEEIECENCPFDAAYHNAVMHIDDEAFGENTVAECFQKGFKIGDKVIRFAMVKVAN
ncbi:MAG: nucleotide exchange factor GrpE [Oscillospiraceae bacterium]|nr:nucleotide exchange factor GrpE [Oscillospiraceae bacterium]